MSEDRALEKVYGKLTYQELELRLRTGEQAFATQAATIAELRARLARFTLCCKCGTVDDGECDLAGHPLKPITPEYVAGLLAKLAEYQQEMSRVKADAIQNIAKLEVKRLQDVVQRQNEEYKQLRRMLPVNGAELAVKELQARADSAESRLAAIAERVRPFVATPVTIELVGRHVQTSAIGVLLLDILRLAEGDQ